MKIILASIILLSSQLSNCLAQGSLTPPGTPGPTMKSLDQIEARTPISSLPFTISSSGSYYLTKNLNVTSGNGITISADKVALDLNGFTISSTAASATGTGILFNGTHTNITIFNGFITGGVTVTGGTYSGPGFGNGIAFTSTPSNVRVNDVSVSGCLTFGINLGFSSTVVKSCVINTVGSYGIYAQLASDSTATNCGFDGFQVNTAENCSGSSSAGTGVYANDTAVNCSGSSSSTYGLYALNASNCRGNTVSGDDGLLASTASNCYGGNAGSGVGLGTTIASGCYGISNAGIGLDAITAQNSYGTSTSGVGLNAITAQNSYGTSTSGIGLGANTAIGCWGMSSSNIGLTTNNALSCNAFSTNGSTGMIATTADVCRAGGNTNSIQCNIAIGCTSQSGTILATGGKFLGTP